VGAALGNARRSVLRQGHSQIGQVLVAVGRAVLDEPLSEVEGALELAVVGVVVLIANSDEVQVAAALVCVEKGVLSLPKSWVLACFSAHQAPTRQRPRTPPM